MYRRNSRDAERVSQVLAGLAYPAAKWQVLMHAENYGADAFTRADLWSLPTGVYADLDAVLSALQDRGQQAEVHGDAPVGRFPLLNTAPLRRAGLRRQPEPQVAGRVRPLR